LHDEPDLVSNFPENSLSFSSSAEKDCWHRQTNTSNKEVATCIMKWQLASLEYYTPFTINQSHVKIMQQ
jgi:hypothetical protein